MKYSKPTIAELQPAIDAVQGASKSGQQSDAKPTTPAYEADE
jgi:hypothetical protein